MQSATYNSGPRRDDRPEQRYFDVGLWGRLPRRMAITHLPRGTILFWMLFHESVELMELQIALGTFSFRVRSEESHRYRRCWHRWWRWRMSLSLHFGFRGAHVGGYGLLWVPLSSQWFFSWNPQFRPDRWDIRLRSRYRQWVNGHCLIDDSIELCLDDDNLIVHPPVMDMPTVMATEFMRVVIPCKPSHPHVNMSLLHQYGQVRHVVTSMTELVKHGLWCQLGLPQRRFGLVLWPEGGIFRPRSIDGTFGLVLLFGPRHRSAGGDHFLRGGRM